MNKFQEDYEAKYSPMRAAMVRVEGELLKRLSKACQGNAWLKVGGIDFEDDLCMESDYPYNLQRFDDLAMLKLFFEHGNWSIRSAVQYLDLIFVNQVNGGDEWWTLKIDGDNLVPFESITWRHIIARGAFEAFMGRLTSASIEACRNLDY